MGSEREASRPGKRGAGGRAAADAVPANTACAPQGTAVAVRLRQDRGQLVFSLPARPCATPRHACLPRWHYPMLRDARRAAAYARALDAAVRAVRERCGRPPHVLDAGSGTGLLGLLALRRVGQRGGEGRDGGGADGIAGACSATPAAI